MIRKLTSLPTALLLIAFISDGYAQILNPGFESESSGFPMDWKLDDFGAGLTPNSHTGNFALEVWNWYYYAEGVAVNGSSPVSFSQHNFIKNGTPFTGIATGLDGFYMYDTTDSYNTVPDSAVVIVISKKWNPSTLTQDTISYGEIHLPVTDTVNYTPFHVDVNIVTPGVIPDSVVIGFKSAVDGFCTSSGSGNCLYFKVDDLSLTSTVGVVDPMSWFQQPSLFPNPTANSFTIKDVSYGSRIEVIDATGRTIYNQETANTQISIDSNHWPKGIYLVRVMTSDKIVSVQKLIKQ